MTCFLPAELGPGDPAGPPAGRGDHLGRSPTRRPWLRRPWLWPRTYSGSRSRKGPPLIETTYIPDQKRSLRVTGSAIYAKMVGASTGTAGPVFPIRPEGERSPSRNAMAGNPNGSRLGESRLEGANGRRRQKKATAASDRFGRSRLSLVRNRHHHFAFGGPGDRMVGPPHHEAQVRRAAGASFIAPAVILFSGLSASLCRSRAAFGVRVSLLGFGLQT